jgi:hypothetical protein
VPSLKFSQQRQNQNGNSVPHSEGVSATGVSAGVSAISTIGGITGGTPNDPNEQNGAADYNTSTSNPFKKAGNKEFVRKNSSMLSTANRGGQFNINTPSALGYTSASGMNVGGNFVGHPGGNYINSASREPDIINFYGSYAEEQEFRT